MGITAQLSLDSESAKSEKYDNVIYPDRSPLPMRSPINSRIIKTPIQQPKSPFPLTIGRSKKLKLL